MPTAHRNPTLSPQVIHSTQRQTIARSYDLSEETVRRWVRFCESCCFDWWHVCPRGVTERYLHGYQVSVLCFALDNRDKGKAWIEHALLNDQRLTFKAWSLTQKQHA